MFFLPLVFRKNSAYARFHSNQSLVVLIFLVVGQVMVRFLPMFSDIVSIYTIVMLILMVLGMLHATKGEAKRLLLVGGIDIIK